MVSVGSRLVVYDNSGAVVVQCIKILGVHKRKYAGPGDKILVVVKKGRSTKNLNKKKVYLGVVVCTTFPVRRLGGEVVYFFTNGVVLLKNDNLPIGTRVNGIVMLELRQKKFMKVVSLSKLCL